MVRQAVDAGVTLFDTADAYSSGVSERVLGRALGAQRCNVEIATKVGYVFSDRSLLTQSVLHRARPIVVRARSMGNSGAPSSSNPGQSSAYASQDFSLPYLRRAVDASLRRLDTDYIDVLQLHGPPSHMAHVLPGLAELVHVGKVRRLGIGAESIDSALAWVAADHLDVLQVPFGVLDPQAAEEVLPIAASRRVESWARGVLGGGILGAAMSGRITGKPTGTDLASPSTHVKWPLIQDLIELAVRAGTTPFELAVDYVRSFRSVSTILLGIHSAEHLAENLRLMQRPLPDRSLIEQIENVIAR